ALRSCSRRPFWGIFAAAHHTPGRVREHAKCGLREAKKSFYFPYVRSAAPALPAGCDAALLDAVELGPIPERREGFRIGAGHPGLGAQSHHFLEQSGPPQRVEV